MALKAVLEQAAYDALSDVLKAEYKEVNGKFTLDVVSVDGLTLENTKGLKDALTKERGNVNTLREQLKKFEGIEDIDELKTAKEKLEALKDATPKDKLEQMLKDREQSIRTAFGKEKDTLLKERDELTKQLESILVDQAATAAIVAQKGKATILLPHVKQQLKVRRLDDGRRVTEVVDGNGNPRVGDANGNPMTVDQLVAEFRTHADFGVAFEASGNSGTGAGAGNKGGSGGSGGGGGGGSGGSAKTIQMGSNTILSGANIEDIASGKSVVQMGSGQ